ncbi:MAG: amidohydrolase family protein [Oscillospiraceae bacterium]
MFDYLIKNGQLIDGTGSPARRADVGITDGKIAAIGDLSAAQAGTVIDAAGKTVTPGFIDIHRHADAALFRPHFGELELKQGLTTIVNGNCGLSVTPCSGPYRGEIEAYLTPVTGELPADADCSSMQAYLDAARRQPSPIHTAMLAGSGTIRACAAGFSAPTLDAAQLRTVRSLIERELRCGRARCFPRPRLRAGLLLFDRNADRGPEASAGFRHSHHRPHAAGGQRRGGGAPGDDRGRARAAHARRDQPSQIHRQGQLAQLYARDAPPDGGGPAGGRPDRL